MANEYITTNELIEILSKGNEFEIDFVIDLFLVSGKPHAFYPVEAETFKQWVGEELVSK